MTEQTRTPSIAEIEQYIAEAHQLRTVELGRIGHQLFHAPRRLLSRVRHQFLSGIDNMAMRGKSL